MKTLFIIRHAKSSWHDMTQRDFDRPLNKRGKTDAPLMGKVLAKAGKKPDLIRSSPALRAITTARIIAESFGYPEDAIQKEPGIYEAGRNKLVRLVSETAADVNVLMIVGHNPGFTDLANGLCNQPTDNLPTCGVYCIDFDIEDWAEIQIKKGHCRFFDYPKRHKKKA